MLKPEIVRVVHRFADLEDDFGALGELQRRCDPSQLEAVDELHDDHGWFAIDSALVDLDDPPIAEQRERFRLTKESGDRSVQPLLTVGAQDLGGDDSIEVQVTELVDFAHPARAETLDRLEPLERGKAGRVAG